MSVNTIIYYDKISFVLRERLLALVGKVEALGCDVVDAGDFPILVEAIVGIIEAFLQCVGSFIERCCHDIERAKPIADAIEFLVFVSPNFSNYLVSNYC